MRTAERLSYVALAGTGIYCLSKSTWSDCPLNFIAFGATLTKACMSLLDQAITNDSLHDLCEVADVLECTFLYPCIVGHLWFVNGGHSTFAMVHPATMMVLYLSSETSDFDSDKVLITGYVLNAVSCIYLCFAKRNIFGLAATLVFMTAIANTGYEDRPLPRVEAANYGLCAVMLFGLYAILKQ